MSNTDSPNNRLVFVYGSLKQGFGNDGLLRDSEFNGIGVTLDPSYDLFSLGGFPGVGAGVSAVSGELYTVDEDTFKRLDVLESNGRMYLREEVEVFDEDGDVHFAWMYIFLGDPWRASPSNMEVVELQTENGFFVQSWERVGASV